MNCPSHQKGVGLAGLITSLLVFVAIAFGVGWVINKYFSHISESSIEQQRTVNGGEKNLGARLADENFSAEEIPDLIATLLLNNSTDQARKALNSARSKIHDSKKIQLIDTALMKLVDAGNIKFSNNKAVASYAMQVSSFTGSVVDGSLVVSWKVVAGDDIATGVDADRPQQLPDDYEFETYIHYTLIIKDLQSGEINEYDYDLFGDEDRQENFILLRTLQIGKYDISIKMVAQYFTDTRAVEYNSKFGLKVHYN